MAVPITLFLVTLLARGLVALLFVEPAYPDAYYYVNLGRELAAGGGFHVDYIWNFVEVGGRLPAQGILPIPSNAHWMPLAALVQVPFIWVLGPTATASALPFWLAAAAVAPVTYLIGRDAAMPRWQAAAAGLLVAMPGGIAPYLGQPDNFALFMLLGTLALWSCARGLRGDRRSFALGGIVVGLASLARNDGILLAVPFLLAFGADRARKPRGTRISWWSALAFGVGLTVIAVPWLLRQLDVFGSVSPSSAGGRILFITEYRELYSVSTETTLEAFLSQGPVALARSRLEGLGSAVGIFAVMPLLVVLVPFLLVGTWLRRRDSAFVPWLIYAVVLLAFSALVSAVHVPYGTFLHSAVALVPFAYLVALLGLAAVVREAAARRHSWNEAQATRNFSLLLVGTIIVVSVVGTLITVRSWEEERDVRMPIMATLAAEATPGDRIMSPDAGAYRYRGGWPGIVTPDDPLEVVEEALRLYQVRWLVLERAHATAGLYPLLSGAVRPDWLSQPLVAVPLPSPDDEGSRSTDAAPTAALFAVCLTADDIRCQP